MQLLSLTRPTTAENLALDEWLLQRCESSETPREILRLWENPVNAVILGRSSRVDEEVNRPFCLEHSIGFYRRSSGGASVVVGPGCLMYSVVLDYRLRPELRMLDQAHHFVMQKMQTAIRRCWTDVEFQGTCDLTVGDRKFSGNSLRCQRKAFLYHGTLLYDFDLELLHACLGTPPRQPEYRGGRSHQEFVTNLPVGKADLIEAIIETWDVKSEFGDVDSVELKRIAEDKYSSQSWTYKR